MDKKTLSIKMRGPKQECNNPTHIGTRQESWGYKEVSKEGNFRID